MANKPTQKPRMSQFFVPGAGIDREVITTDICRYLGNDALVKPGVFQDPKTGEMRQGYYITAYRALTTEQLADLKADSARWEAERRKNPPSARNPGSGEGYKVSNTRRQQQWAQEQVQAPVVGYQAQQYAPPPGAPLQRESQNMPDYGRTFQSQQSLAAPASYAEFTSPENYPYHRQVEYSPQGPVGGGPGPVPSTQAPRAFTSNQYPPDGRGAPMLSFYNPTTQAMPNPPMPQPAQQQGQFPDSYYGVGQQGHHEGYFEESPYDDDPRDKNTRRGPR